jgi:hypothetical protein
MVAANEFVGQNLHDNMNMPIYVSVTKPITVTLAKVFTLTTAWQYFWDNSGKVEVKTTSLRNLTWYSQSHQLSTNFQYYQFIDLNWVYPKCT